MVMPYSQSQFSKKSRLTWSLYEKSCKTASYGGLRAGITVRIANKPGITKGGHTVLVSGVHCFRPRAYRHRHKFYVDPPGCNVWGNIEVK